jgi:hypothetical protein
MTAEHQTRARRGRVRSVTLGARAALASALFASIVPSPASAQRADSARAAASARPRAARDTVRAARPPISAKRAFLRSLLIPGWGQSSLDRGTAGGLFATIELLSAAMIVKSKQDLDFAKRYGKDSIVTGFTGGTGSQGTVSRAANPLKGRISPRRQHLEDWIALLVFNHLFSGADAFVAAQLWDVPAGVSIRSDGGTTVTLAARVSW